ncbi:MAG TPA: FAD-dependent oxidoreductase [Streptosporangiaceae bacterium]|nr:FAD-dependent oxidoreductase [Streptosporangiaceae bacterium]
MRSGAGQDPMVIIGGGLAGGNAAATLREEGFRGRVVVISREPGVPFGRPPLSKTYLRSEETLEDWYVRPAGWYADHDVELLTGSRVAVIDTAARTVAFAEGQELSYQKLLLATGGQNRRLDVPGAQLPGIHQLRTVAECDAIKAEAAPNRRAVVVGMGFIGCEVAASLTQLGVRVTGILPGRVPLERVLGPEVGALVAAIHRANGVTVLSGEEVVGFDGDDRVAAVVTASGKRIECDFVVVGVGITVDIPRVTGSPVALTRGVLADEWCRTSAPDVYAAGDVANQLHPLFGRVRVEHYNNAEKQGVAAARSMLGSDARYDYVHTFWSDQYDHKIEYVGHASTWDEFVVRGSTEDGRLIGFYLQGGLVQAAIGLDRGGDPELEADSEMAACAQLVARRARPERGLLDDERVDLWSLARRA